MEIFYSETLHEAAGTGMAVKGAAAFLGEDESAHCIRVLRHRAGDRIKVIDGKDGMYECIITEPSPKRCGLRIEDFHGNWGGHGYTLHIACCPTKNSDRFEWFMEKATEIGIDTVIPIIGEHSERKTIKRERAEKLLLSAAKQSLKGRIPVLEDCISVTDFIKSEADKEADKGAGRDGKRCLKLIAYCFHGDGQDARKDMFEEMEKHFRDNPNPEILVMIGPEGDFSDSEASLAISSGFIPVSMGDSRLRTETAALMAAAAAYGAASRHRIKA